MTVVKSPVIVIAEHDAELKKYVRVAVQIDVTRKCKLQVSYCLPT